MRLRWNLNVYAWEMWLEKLIFFDKNVFL
jgi:hypothetical protein